MMIFLFERYKHFLLISNIDMALSFYLTGVSKRLSKEIIIPFFMSKKDHLLKKIFDFLEEIIAAFIILEILHILFWQGYVICNIKETIDL